MARFKMDGKDFFLGSDKKKRFCKVGDIFKAR